MVSLSVAFLLPVVNKQTIEFMWLHKAASTLKTLCKMWDIPENGLSNYSFFLTHQSFGLTLSRKNLPYFKKMTKRDTFMFFSVYNSVCKYEAYWHINFLLIYGCDNRKKCLLWSFFLKWHLRKYNCKLKSKQEKCNFTTNRDDIQW